MLSKDRAKYSLLRQDSKFINKRLFLTLKGDRVYSFAKKENKIMIDTNQETGAESETGTGEGTKEDVVTLPRSEYSKLSETIGSLKRDIKDLKKAKDETPIKTESKSDDKLGTRLDTLALKMAGIVKPEEKALFDKWKGETGREADAIVENSIFQKELEDIRVASKNQEATSNIKGEQGGASIKDDPDYWISRSSKDAKGMPVFPEEMPREMFSKVLDKLSTKTQGNKLKYYNSK